MWFSHHSPTWRCGKHGADYCIIPTMSVKNLDQAQKQLSSLYQGQQKLRICVETPCGIPAFPWALVSLLWSSETPNILKEFVCDFTESLAFMLLRKSPSPQSAAFSYWGSKRFTQPVAQSDHDHSSFVPSPYRNLFPAEIQKSALYFNISVLII